MNLRLNRDDRRDQLLTVAVELLDADGPSAMTMERLAARAGVSKPVVYDHFANRSELVVAVLARTWAEAEDRVAERVAGSPTPADRLRATFDALVDNAARRGPNVRALLDSASSDPHVEQARRARWAEKEAAWAAGLERELGLAPPLAAAAAATLRAAMIGAVAHARTSPEARAAAADVYVTTVAATLRALSGRDEGDGGSPA